MFRLLILTLGMLLSASAALAQRSNPPTKAELAEITERGKQPAEYDIAALYATNAVMTIKPEEGSVARYIARKNNEKWTAVFGRFNKRRDKFLIVYEAKNQRANPKESSVKEYNPPEEDAGFHISAAKAIETALADFRGENRP